MKGFCGCGGRRGLVKVMPYVSALALILAVFVQRWEAAEHDGGQPAVTILAEAIFLSVMLACLYVAGKVYAQEWKRLSGNTLALRIFSWVFLPSFIVFLLVDLEVSIGVWWWGVVLFAWFGMVDFGGAVEACVLRWFGEINHINRRVCYSKYPPMTRSDMFPMDLYFWGLIIFVGIKKLA